VSRVVITSLGPAEKLGAAMVPIRAQSAQAYQSRGVIDGNPGIQAIPAPRPPLPQDTSGLAHLGGYHRSSQAPAYWYPGVYYEVNNADAPAEKAAVSVFSDNQMPMPALSPLGLPSVMMGRPRLGGQFQQANRASVPAYPSLGGSSG